jgi:predicted dinucleotide-binding enzyme
MARALGIVWAERGHRVFFGSRDPAKARACAALGPGGIESGSNDQAAAFGDVVVHTVRAVMPSAVLASTAALAGKVLVCINNRTIPKDFAFETMIGPSLAEALAADVPGARVVKAFNTMAQEVFEHPSEALRGYDVSSFLCGDDADAKKLVAELSRDAGLNPIDCGSLRAARMLESMGDFIRYMMFGMKRGYFATISVRDIPAAAGRRLGGRKPYGG